MTEPTTPPAGAITTFRRDSLRVEVHPDATAAGQAAAERIASAISRAVDERGAARVVFAAAPSQTHTLTALQRRAVPWAQVEALHMDEYVGLPGGSPARFGNWLARHLFDAVPIKQVHLIDPGTDPLAECERYAELIRAAPIDVVVAGVGENGHLAFNDPPVADFADPLAVKVVDLDAACRRQQVHDGQFARLGDVPRQAVTVTVPALLSARTIACIVPGARKRAAVEAALFGPVAPACPASALRTHPDATLYLDRDAAPESAGRFRR